jgi:hypothetical protein
VLGVRSFLEHRAVRCTINTVGLRRDDTGLVASFVLPSLGYLLTEPTSNEPIDRQAGVRVERAVKAQGWSWRGVPGRLSWCGGSQKPRDTDATSDSSRWTIAMLTNAATQARTMIMRPASETFRNIYT